MATAIGSSKHSKSQDAGNLNDAGRERSHGNGNGYGFKNRAPAAPATSHAAHAAPAKEELLRRCGDLEDLEAEARQEEAALRVDLAEATAARNRAHVQSTKAKEALELARKRMERSRDFVRGRISEMMEKMVQSEQAARDLECNEVDLQQELDVMVLAQASMMATRDELLQQSAFLRLDVKAASQKVDELEKKLRKARDGITKDRLRVELLKQELQSNELKRLNGSSGSSGSSGSAMQSKEVKGRIAGSGSATFHCKEVKGGSSSLSPGSKKARVKSAGTDADLLASAPAYVRLLWPIPGWCLYYGILSSLLTVIVAMLFRIILM